MNRQNQRLLALKAYKEARAPAEKAYKEAMAKIEKEEV